VTRSAATFLKTLPAVAACLALAPASASATTSRYTTPDATATSGSCTWSTPCRVDVAINGAASGDQVKVASGTYLVTVPLQTQGAVDIKGDDDTARPVFVGPSSFTVPLLVDELGGKVKHLALQSNAPGQAALELAGGKGDDLILTSSTNNAAKLHAASPATVLEDAVVRTGGAQDSALMVDSSGSGTVELRNLTVNGPGLAIKCDVADGTVALVNVIARGGAGDVDATGTPGACTASYSNLRPELSPGLVLGAGMQSSDPLLDADGRPVATSPTIDAGTDDGELGDEDPDGRTRILGAAPDIGAYEYPGVAAPSPSDPGSGTLPAPAPTPESDLPRDLKGIPAAVIGSTIIVAPGQGKVLVRKPGTSQFKRLDEPKRLPVGTTIDATQGRLRLVSAIDAFGTTQTAHFWGGRFTVGQSTVDGMTSLKLAGGDFSRCPATAGASAVGRETPVSHRVVRSLWARDNHGRFRTFGHNSVATARGTNWVTRDRCDGTLTRVLAGAVSVRDRARGRTVLVRAGHGYLARARN
jgi:hypothetical protein